MDFPAIDALDGLDKSELKSLFEKLFKRLPPARVGRAFMTLNIAWELQAREYGGLSARLKRRLDTLHRKFQDDPDYDPFGTRTIMKPGTRLVREWQGRPHVVTATADGYEYDGRFYRYLSVIAREITGTQWSGPAFFGLKRRRTE